MIALLLTLTACNAQQPAPPPASVTTRDLCHRLTDNKTQPLYGKCENTQMTIPEFKALSHDGTPRSKADLLGHPTVLWFFPVAGTPG